MKIISEVIRKQLVSEQ